MQLPSRVGPGLFSVPRTPRRPYARGKYNSSCYSEVGKAGTVPTKDLPLEVDVNLYSHPQAKRDGDMVTLSTDQDHYYVQTPDRRRTGFGMIRL